MTTGAFVGDNVGFAVGDGVVGESVGAIVGDNVGSSVGESVGDGVVGEFVGDSVGASVDGRTQTQYRAVAHSKSIPLRSCTPSKRQQLYPPRIHGASYDLL